MTLKVTISGVRGISGESLTAAVADDFAKAFADYTEKGTIVIGSDTRRSGPQIKDIVVSRLTKEGCRVIDIGIAPTPTVQLAVRKNGASGGIIITASHNPPQWNGLKFVRSDGIFLNEAQANRLISMYEKISSGPKPPNTAGTATSCSVDKTAIDHHIQLVLAAIDAEAVKANKFKVAIDCCNGAGSGITPKLLRALGCEIFAINTDITSDPPRGSEPVPQNLGQLCTIVKKFGADVGFAQDPDADRLSIVSEEGKAIGEEYSLALAADHVFSLNAGEKDMSSATNLSTSRMIEDIAKKYGAGVVRTKVGEVNVSEKMKEIGAVIGGEGNGGIIYPKVGYGRDSIIGIALILWAMACSGKKLSQLAGQIKSYEMIKDKIEMARTEDILKLLARVKEKYSKEKIDASDGLKIDLAEGWLHVRGSNTEPIVRIIAEGIDKGSALKLIEGIKALA